MDSLIRSTPAALDDQTDQFVVDLAPPDDLDMSWTAVPMAIEFTDNRGRRWRRTPNAKLHVRTESGRWKRWR